MADPVRSQLETRAGLLLVAAAVAALVLANGPWAETYHHALEMRLGPAMPRLGVMSVHQWIADGAMALFFLLVGLEVKREWIGGRLADRAERRLPIVAALAGMAIPAVVFLAVIEWTRPWSAAGQSLRRPTSPLRLAFSPYSGGTRRQRSRYCW
jgi:NhaA family Na+:H+ antiporter